MVGWTVDSSGRHREFALLVYTGTISSQLEGILSFKTGNSALGKQRIVLRKQWITPSRPSTFSIDLVMKEQPLGALVLF
jgi:hypothetical protein